MCRHSSSSKSQHLPLGLCFLASPTARQGLGSDDKSCSAQSPQREVTKGWAVFLWISCSHPSSQELCLFCAPIRIIPQAGIRHKTRKGSNSHNKQRLPHAPREAQDEQKCSSLLVQPQAVPEEVQGGQQEQFLHGNVGHWKGFGVPIPRNACMWHSVLWAG